jgi:hypothetical protein
MKLLAKDLRNNFQTAIKNIRSVSDFFSFIKLNRLIEDQTKANNIVINLGEKVPTKPEFQNVRYQENVVIPWDLNWIKAKARTRTYF